MELRDSGRSRLRFPLALAAIAAAGLVLRVIYTIAVAPPTTGLFDSFYFRVSGRLVADGAGFSNPYLAFADGRLVPSAQHPPLYILVLALEQWLGLTADELQRSTGAVFGGATVVLVGLVGRRVAGDGGGLAAAGIAAVYPMLIVADGALMSETLYAALVAACILAAYRLIDRPVAGAALVLGLLVGLAALTRSEALALVALLGIPAARQGGGAWLGRLGICALATVVVVSPWVVRNWIVFDTPVMSNNLGAVIVQTNCPSAYYGRDVGFIATDCIRSGVPGREAEQSAEWRREGLEYAADHTGRLPVVAVVRVLRQWAFWAPWRMVRDGEGRDVGVQRLGVVMSWVLLPLAVLGALQLRRRRTPLAPLLAPALLTVVVGALTFGSLRLRIAADIPLVVLAGAAIAALPKLRSGRGEGAPVP